MLSLVAEELPQILDNMRAQGYKLVVVYVGDEPCPPMPEAVLLHEIGDAFEGLEFADRRHARRFAAMNSEGD